MNSTLGYTLILAGLGFAVFGAVVGFWGGFTGRDGALAWVRRAVYGFAACMLGSNLLMIVALLQHDFSVKYGSRSTPTIFTIVSLWSSLEGSILFWGAILGIYLFAFAFLYRKERTRYLQLALAVMCVVAIFFSFLIAGPANPWPAISPVPPDGPGPNPLLQNHWLMIVHPPMLYLGFVGMTVPFGIASGALLRGELTDTWLVPLRKWMLVPWLFLTIGIILGSWWAYAVLGWGGYWAWDPVENASFLPWLTATAFMHSTMVLERKRMLKLWTLALALTSFLLTIYGTFLTRSGVFNSVHAFSFSDIGPTFLVFLAVAFVFSVVVLSVRGHLLVAEHQLDSLVSREGSILVNNLVFVAITFTVFLGTTFPVLVEALQDKRISVGEPYFNKMAVPGGLMVLFLMGAGPMLPWGSSSYQTLRRQVLIPGVVGLAIVAVCLAFGLRGFAPLLTFGLAGFVTVITLRELLLPARQRMQEKQETAWLAFARSASRAPRRFGGYIVHLGIVVIIVAIAASSAYKLHHKGTLAPGETLQIADYTIRFDALTSGREPHRDWTAANLTITDGRGRTESLTGQKGPRMNIYERSTDPVGTPAVRPKLFEDLYISLIAYDGDGKSASLNAWVFPMAGWIWYSIPILLLGTLIALLPRRQAAPSLASAPPTSSAPPSPGDNELRSGTV